MAKRRRLFSDGSLGKRTTYVVGAHVNYQGLLTLKSRKDYYGHTFDPLNHGETGLHEYYNLWFWDVNVRLKHNISESAFLILTEFKYNPASQYAIRAESPN